MGGDTSSVGGAPGSFGGAPGSFGGAPGSVGGAPGSIGGAPGSVGGAPGSGGTSAAGGATGTGGSGVGGAGGTLSPACLQPRYMHTSGFGAILDGWNVAANSTPPTLAPALNADGGLASGTRVEIDTSDGSPGTTPVGSAKLTIPFDAPLEEMLFAQNSNGLNLMGETISAWIKLDSGLNTSPVNVGRAFMIVKSTALYVYAAGPVVSLDPSAGWVQISIDANHPQAGVPLGYDPCDIREIDVSVGTGGVGVYTTAVVHIDTISASAPSGGDGGGS